MRKVHGRLLRKSQRKEKGFLLIVVLSFIATITILSAAVLAYCRVEIASSRDFENRMAAFHWAEGALDQTISALRVDHSYSQLPATAVSNDRASGIYYSAVASAGNNVYLIEATGEVNSNDVAAQQRTVQAYIDLSPPSMFNMALFSRDAITMSGNASINAYDSSEGPYHSTTATDEGHIGTNAAGSGAITLSGNVRIKGNATVGPEAVHDAIRTSGNADITGTRSSAARATVIPPVVIPGHAVASGALNVSGNTVQTLAGGTYRFTSLSITGNGKVVFTGSAEVYVTGNVSISGNGFGTASNLPPNLKIYVEGSRTVSLTGNGAFYGAIVAPDSSVQISGNGKLLGAVVGNSITVSGNGDIHYDKALAGAGSSPTTGDQLMSWLEI